MGSVRWWTEALIRGLGGYACDPTGDERCSFDEVAYGRTGEPEDGLRDVCPACRLFGCSGWSSKLRLLLTDGEGGYEVNLSQPGISFTMNFVEVKPTEAEERWLLAKAVWLITRYGSLGGKTTLKPPQPDYGLVTLASPLRLPTNITRKDVQAWLARILDNSSRMQERLRRAPPEWPDLRLFFFNTGRYLDLSQVNELVRVDPSGFLSGRRGVSKKVFSFQTVHRFWGYARDREMLEKVMATLQRLGVSDTRTGGEVLDEL
jgi:CRISPR-associated protein Cmr1